VRILDTYCSLSTGEDDGTFWSKIEFTYSLTLTPLYDTYNVVKYGEAGHHRDAGHMATVVKKGNNSTNS